MKIFGKFLEEAGKALQDVATEENKEKAKQALSSFGEKLNSIAGDVKNKLEEAGFNLEEMEKGSKPKENITYETDYEAERPELTYEEARDRILKVISIEFPNYEVFCDVSPTKYGGTGRFMNYSIVVCENGNPKLFIMLIGKTTTAHREYRFSKEFAQKLGVTMINFVVHFPNEIPYINQRLHNYL